MKYSEKYAFYLMAILLEQIIKYKNHVKYFELIWIKEMLSNAFSVQNFLKQNAS
jgi:hypothetical protein